MTMEMMDEKKVDAVYDKLMDASRLLADKAKDVLRSNSDKYIKATGVVVEFGGQVRFIYDD